MITKESNQRFLVKHKLSGVFKFIGKLSIPFILFVNLILDLFSKHPVIQYNYDRSVEVTGFGLLMIGFLFVDGFLRGKCYYFYLSLLGLATNSCINIYFFGNYQNEYYTALLIVPEFIISFFVLAFIFIEKDNSYD